MQVLLISLGCPKNLVDSEIILGILQEHGFVITSNCFEAEIALVNTCAFIQEAKQEAIDTIFELAELKKQGSLKVLIVCGCLAQRYKYELTDLLGEVDAFVGTGSIGEIDKIIKSCLKGKRCFSFKNNHYLNQPNFHRVLLTPGHYAYIKIADGCDNACSYCVIPQIRGRYCSRNIESIAREAEFLSQKGVKEIILVSQDNTFYGKDIYGKYCLDVLLKELVQIKRLHWIRILYAYPNNITDNLIKVVAREQKICKYLDLPIQHINDRILQLMRRHITGRQIKDLIFKLRSMIPELVLRTSIIVGFPSETRFEFKQLYDFVGEIKFERLGVFMYSKEENTSAALISPCVSRTVKKNRLEKIMRLQLDLTEKRNMSLINSQMQVLIDSVQADGIGVGRSEFDTPEIDGLVYVKGAGIKQGSLVNVEITDSYLYDLIGNKI